MRRFFSLMTIAAFVALATPALAGKPYPTTQEELEAELEAMPWEGGAGRYELPLSNAALDLPDGYVVLRGDAARRYDYLSQGVEDPSVEGLIYLQDGTTILYFTYDGSGYVTVDDWAELDSDSLLEDMKQGTIAGNAERVENGIEPFFVVDWIDRPTLDRDSNAVYWAVEMTGPNGGADERFVNATALKLGRHGYESIIWVGSIEEYNRSTELQTVARDYLGFQPGFRFADFTEGDAVAAFGIASLVAVAAGGNSNAAKAGIAGFFAAVLLFFKKFIFVPIMIALAAVGAVFKRFMGGRG